MLKTYRILPQLFKNNGVILILLQLIQFTPNIWIFRTWCRECPRKWRQRLAGAETRSPVLASWRTLQQSPAGWGRTSRCWWSQQWPGKKTNTWVDLASHLNAHPGPDFHFGADPDPNLDPNFQFDADPDQFWASLAPFWAFKAPFSSLHGSFWVSMTQDEPRWLYF